MSSSCSVWGGIRLLEGEGCGVGSADELSVPGREGIRETGALGAESIGETGSLETMGV